MKTAGVRGRLLLILGLAGLALLAASATALVALLEIRGQVAAVTDQALPASGAALVLARVGERLQDRTPALMAAKGADDRRRQSDLLKSDLLLLATETERLRRLQPGGSGVEAIGRLAPELAGNLRQLADLLEQGADQAAALERQRDRLIGLRERVQQILGPSILAVADVMNRGAAAPDRLFRQAALAQGPLLEAERLVGAAFGELLVGTSAPTEERVGDSRATFERLRERLALVIPAVPSGLRGELEAAIDDLDRQVETGGVLGLRGSELATLSQADRLVAGSRAVAARLKGQVDEMVLAANRSISRAAAGMGDTVLANTVLFVAISVSVMLLATFFSYRYVVRDIAVNLRAVTEAMQHLAGGERDARVPAMDRHDEIGDLARVFNVFKDQSRLLATTFDNIDEGFTLFDEGGRLLAWNPQLLRLYDLAECEVQPGTPLGQILARLEEKGACARTAAGEPILVADLAQTTGDGPREIEVVYPDGRIRELRRNPVAGGGFVALHLDVTERRAIEGQLRQAQKMEAVGQLTGGLGHDFNNILGVILGNLTLLEPAPSSGPALHARWRRAMGAADRAANQVQRLLAFSRRQRLAPEAVDLNALVRGMLDLVESSLGPDIVLETDLSDGLPAVRVDPGQLENSLINLAINARDAMRGQGRIAIATAPVGTGAVEIRVSDTGCGIPAELIERVCEPFFTTKPSGKGSGLGLSMVYGFVRQSGGELQIESAPGQGTRVRIALPVAAGAELPADLAGTAESAQIHQGRGETVLAVDDDLDLLAASAEQIGGLGYRVLAAGDGTAALEILGREPSVRLLYTDVAMPAPWDGPALAREALARRPGLALLYTSGEHRGCPDPPAELLSKPVALGQLAAALRRALDAQTFSTSTSKR